jgi:cytochrome c-type biogenesis protein CcmF
MSLLLLYEIAMEIAEILIMGAALLLFGDLIQLINSKGRTGKVGIPMAPLACLLISGSYLILAQAFVNNNFRYEEVYAYSSSGLSLAGRLYASWSSSAGSWLFLTFLLALGYLIIRFKMRDRELEVKAFEFLDVMLLFFILVVLLQSPFKLYPETMMDGRGLNPLLQTPWMLIHPPIVFIGYVLAFLSFAFTFDSLGKNDPSKTMMVKGLSQLAWLFLTLGIALGGVWAYEVLGWGGYWAWDPVETASLIPWITLTAFFHLSTAISKRESSSREFMVMITSSLVILATAITRGGLAVSVHAFGQSPIGLILLFLMGASAAYFLYRQRKTGAPLFDLNLETTSVYSTSLSLSFISLIMLSLVSLWGLLFPIFSGAISGGSTSMDASFFNKWSYPFVLVFVASLIGCHLYDKLDMKKYAGIVGGLFVIGVVGAFAGFPTSNMLANLGIPLSLFALGGVVYGTMKSLMGSRRSIMQAGRSFIHMGVVFVVLGILLSSTSVTEFGQIHATPGTALDLGDMQIDFGDFNILEPFGNVHTSSTEACCNPEATGLEIPVTVKRGGTTLSGVLRIYLYTIHGIVSKPLVLRSLDSDFYFVLQQTDDVYFSLVHTMIGMPTAPSEFVVNVTTFPLMNIIWLGVVLMCVGILFPLFKLRRTR